MVRPDDHDRGRVVPCDRDSDANLVLEEDELGYDYDALGGRIEKADYTVDESSPLTARYVYDGPNVVEECGASGNEHWHVLALMCLIPRPERSVRCPRLE